MDRSYDGNWHTTIAPYVWAPTVKTNIQFAIPALHVPGNGVFSESLKIKPNDYLSKINAGALFSVDARKGPLYVFGDFIYLNATANLNASGTIPVPHSAVNAPFYVTTSTRLSQRIWELAAGFSLFHGRNGDLNLFGGWRDFPIDTTVGYTAVVGSKGQLSTSGTITSKVSAGDVIFGLRGKTYLGDGHWYVPYYLDMGVGSNNQSWQGFTGAGYVFDHGQTLTLGYRTLNYNAFPYDANIQKFVMQGGLLGYTFQL